LLPLRYMMFAAQHRGTREQQQDTVNSSLPELQEERGVICVLSDGMGGLTAGAQVSLAVAETMVSTFNDSPVTDTPEQILLRGCSFCQQKALAIREQAGDAGATLAAVLLRNGRCSFLSVGDSRIYLFRAGALILLTRDQNKRNRIERQIGLGRMPEEALRDATRSALSAYIGKPDLDQADRGSRSFAVSPGDRILLVSDGVYTTLAEAEMAQAMTLPGEAGVRDMIYRVVGKNLPGQDNCSAAVVDCLAAV